MSELARGGPTPGDLPPEEPAESAYIDELPLALREGLTQAWAENNLSPRMLQAEQVQAFAVQTHLAVTEVAKADVVRFKHFTQEPSHILIPNTNHEIERWLERYYTVYPPGRHSEDSVMARKRAQYLGQRVAIAASMAPHFPQISYAQRLGHHFQDAGLTFSTIAMRDLIAAYGDRLSILRGMGRKS